MGAGADFEVDVRIRDAEFLEETAGHGPVVMLAVWMSRNRSGPPRFSAAFNASMIGAIFMKLGRAPAMRSILFMVLLFVWLIWFVWLE